LARLPCSVPAAKAAGRGTVRAWRARVIARHKQVAGRCSALHFGGLWYQTVPLPRRHSRHALPMRSSFRHISRPFADRNSLLAGNLAANFKNRAEFALFGVPARLDHVTNQEVRRNSLFRGRTGNCRGKTGNSLEGHWRSGAGLVRCSVRNLATIGRVLQTVKGIPSRAWHLAPGQVLAIVARRSRPVRSRGSPERNGCTSTHPWPCKSAARNARRRLGRPGCVAWITMAGGARRRERWWRGGGDFEMRYSARHGLHVAEIRHFHQVLQPDLGPSQTSTTPAGSNFSLAGLRRARRGGRMTRQSVPLM
jgi:hypothetical protein